MLAVATCLSCLSYFCFRRRSRVEPKWIPSQAECDAEPALSAYRDMITQENPLEPDFYLQRILDTITPSAARTLKYHEVEFTQALNDAIERETNAHQV